MQGLGDWTRSSPPCDSTPKEEPTEEATNPAEALASDVQLGTSETFNEWERLPKNKGKERRMLDLKDNDKGLKSQP